MYWDNSRIADYYAAKDYRAEMNYLRRRSEYINSLIIVDAIWVFDSRAFVDGDFNGEFTSAANTAYGALDSAVWDANKTLDSGMELDIDEDLTLTLVENDNYCRVVGCTTDEGMDILENALIDCRSFGSVEIFCK